MAYSAPPNFTTGQIVTEANLDTLSDDITFLAGPPRCRVYNSAAISVANATDQALTFNSERYDTDTMHSTAVNTSRITFTTAGLYAVGATLQWASNATGYRETIIMLGGTTFIAGVSTPAVNGAVTLQTLSTTYPFTAGQYVELRVYQNSGGALNIEQSSSLSPEFWARLVAVA